MTIQRLWTFLLALHVQRTASRFITSFMLLILIVAGLPALSGAQVCPPDGDVDRNGSVTAADALLAFQQALGLAQLTACQQTIANVFPQPNAPDGSITASDALCIFQKALGLPSCLDTVSSTNLPPVADAGLEQFVFGNDLVTLSGSGSDSDGTVVSYRWAQTSGPPVVLSGVDTPTASFTAPEVAFENLLEELEFQLTVTDDDGASDTAVVLVVVFFGSATNEPPTANAGDDQIVSENTLVMLSGSGVDSDGFIIGYNWLQLDGTPVELLGWDTPNASFFAPEVDSAEDLVFELAVFDDELGFATDTVTISVLNGISNTPPVADAGRDRTVDENTQVTLSGSGTDSDGTIVSYRWTQTSGTSVTLSDANTQTASFTAPDVDSDTELVFQLTVTDGGGASGVDTVTVTIRAVPASSGLRAEFFENPAPGKPNYVITGDNASLQYWGAPDGTVRQSLHQSADGTQRTRVFFNDTTELPQVVLDEVSGNWLSIREQGDSRVDFWAYGSDGSYQGGFGIYEEDGQYYIGEVVGVPAHEGREITGELNPSSGSLSGSFTLIGDPADGLTNIRVLSAEQVMFLESLQALEGSTTNANSPVVAAIDTLREGLFLAGTAVAVIAAIPSAPLWMPLAAGGLLAGALFLPDVKDAIRGSARDIGCESFDEGMCSLVGVHLAHPDSRGPIGFIRDLFDWTTKLPEELSERLRTAVDSGTQYIDNVATGLFPDDNTGTSNVNQPASLIGPPTVPGSLSGTTSGPTGTSTQVTGTINTSGNFNVSGPNVTISGSYANGAVTGGTFQHGASSGTISQPGRTSQGSAFFPSAAEASASIPTDAEASAFFPSETNYIRENCSPQSCTDLYNCYRCTDLYNSYRCTDLYNSYPCTDLYNSHRCTDLYNSYSCTGSGPTAQACRNERDMIVSSCRKQRDNISSACRDQRDNYAKSCRDERDNNAAACRRKRDNNVAACRASQ